MATESAARLGRRDFLRGVAAAAAACVAGTGPLRAGQRVQRTGAAPAAAVCRCVGGSPEENLERVLDLLGGVEALFEADAVVVVKPNVQWWNQGAPNLAALRRLVDLVLARRGFTGEVVLAENCHRGAAPERAAGWSQPFVRNGAEGLRHMGDLVLDLKRRHGDRFTLRHWRDVDAGARRVAHPRDGEGYVYCDGTGGVPLLACANDRPGGEHRRTIMTYPVFATDRGTVVDFKHGVWGGAGYTDRPLRFVNVAALNHHSTYCGVTSALKNYLGVTDLSGGPDPRQGGRLCADYHNFHAFPFTHWGEGPQPGMLGRAVGTFMATVRRADLNITTAEWVGLASRIDAPAARTRAVLGSTDPVALDYHAAKYLLHPHSGVRAHDPDWAEGPFRSDLVECARAMGGTLDEAQVEVRSLDLGAGRLQDDTELRVPAEVTWGTDPKALLKYAYLRVFR